MSNIYNRKSDTVQRLDKEIIKADERVVSLYKALEQIDVDKRGSEKELANSLQSLDRELTASIKALDNNLADYIKSLDNQITAAVTALSFDPALRNQILEIQRKLTRLKTQQAEAKTTYQQIET